MAKPRILWRDLVDETIAGLTAKIGRTIWMVSGTIAGVATLVSIVGLSRTTGNRINENFNALTATEVIVEPETQGNVGGGTVNQSALPWDAEKRLARLNGVVASGTLSALFDLAIHPFPIPDQADPTLPIKAASPGLFRSINAKLLMGRYFDSGHSIRADRVCILGATAAQRLNINRLDTPHTINFARHTYLVIGVIRTDQTSPRAAELYDAVIVPNGTAQRDFQLKAPTSVHIDTARGATRLIESQAPAALNPAAPDRLSARRTSGAPTRLRDQTKQDINFLYLAIGGVVLLLAAAFITALSITSVQERTGEIGLRRALGASQRHITMQFLAECATIGVIGGLTGTAIGIAVTVGTAASRNDTPVLDAWLPIAAAGGGVLLSIVAGLYPAFKAARLEPVDALRSST
jgi:macrolide transport system ATP-binding/permease protein